MKNWVIKVATITVLLFQYSLFAAECTDLQFLTDKSPGTQIISNDCYAQGGLSVGSQLALVAGARLWLKATYDELSNQQLICQNRSEKTIQLRVASAEAPWVQVENLKNCQHWVNNRLNCTVAQQQKFFCVSGIIKKPLNLAKQERTTSISMRAISIGKPSSIPDAESYVNRAVANMHPEIDLCRNLVNSQEPVELIWNVKASGQVDDVSILTEGNNELSSCIRDVVANYQYPKPNEIVTFVYEF